MKKVLEKIIINSDGRKMCKFKVFEAFAGYGGASFALKRANIDYEVIGISEIDKYATKLYYNNHETVKNYGDITKINPNDLPDFDIFTGGFPCQPFSIAGLRKGVNDKRGLLFNDIIRILELKKPKYVILENVKGLLATRHKEFLEYTLSELKRIGYDFKINLYNSKDYGTPQNRERVIYICQRDKLDFIDIEKSEIQFNWKDKLILKNVEHKYYLSDEAIKRMEKTTFRNDITRRKYINTLTAGMHKKNWNTPIIVDFRYNEGVRFRKYDFMITITTKQNGLSGRPIIIKREKYRFLTPKECFRFMGFFEDEIKLNGLSDTQLYKLAGNGWDINLFSKIFYNLLKINKCEVNGVNNERKSTKY